MKPAAVVLSLLFLAGAFAQGVLHDTASVEIVERAPQLARIAPIEPFCILLEIHYAAPERDWAKRFALASRRVSASAYRA
jgi:hypothetical protein